MNGWGGSRESRVTEVNPLQTRRTDQWKLNETRGTMAVPLNTRDGGTQNKLPFSKLQSQMVVCWMEPQMKPQTPNEWRSGNRWAGLMANEEQVNVIKKTHAAEDLMSIHSHGNRASTRGGEINLCKYSVLNFETQICTFKWTQAVWTVLTDSTRGKRAMSLK